MDYKIRKRIASILMGKTMDYKIRKRIASILIEEKVPADTEITVLGLVRTVRISKEVAFIEIN